MKKYFLYNISLLLILGMICCGFSGCKEKKTIAKIAVSYSGPAEMTMSYKGKDLDGLTRKLAPGSYIFKFSAPGHKPKWQQFDLTAADNNSTIKVQMEAETSAVFVSCSTDASGKDGNVSVFLNGAEQGVTPCLITGIPLGEHTLELTHPGYAAKTVQIKVKDSRPLPLIKEQLVSNSAMLRVTGRPAGATLYIDEKLAGPIPYQAKYTAGKYLLELRSPGFISKKQEVVLHPNQSAKAEIVLEPMPSSLTISSTPANAVCFIRGEKKGTTPLRVENLQPGNYKIKVQHPGYEAVEELVEIKPGSNEELTITLESGFGFARLNIQPAGVDVFVDGKLIGRSQPDPQHPDEVLAIVVPNLTPGTHTCTLSHPRAKPRTIKKFNFNVSKNKTTECPVFELWVANCEITYKRSGMKDQVKIIRIDDREIEFSLQPGISMTEKLDNVQIRKLDLR